MGTVFETDHIIVGQGLAGSFMAHFLLQAGQKVMLIDTPQASSSRVAAGLFNPVTGRRFTKTWLADEIFPFAEDVYREMEKLLGMRFYFPYPMLRLFQNRESYTEAKEKGTEASGKYISSFNENPDIAGLKTNAGACQINHAGYVNAPAFIQAYSQWLLKKGLLRPMVVNYEDIQLGPGSVRWKNIEAKNIIFCEGNSAIYNPYFNWLPFRPAKGESITIKAPGLSEDSILIRGIYIIPMGDSTFRIGATYTWTDQSLQPTEGGKEELCKKLDEIIAVPYEVIGHQAGIRPATKHRRPFVGLHPEHKNVAILNGLGTKGITLAPYFAKQLTNHILYGMPVNPEADIKNYASDLSAQPY
jgi:glycine/D-amino acid oxidase-like deaminating enzyme